MRKSPRQKERDRQLIQQFNQNNGNTQLVESLFKHRLDINELLKLERFWLHQGYEAGFNDGLEGRVFYTG